VGQIAFQIRDLADHVVQRERLQGGQHLSPHRVGREHVGQAHLDPADDRAAPQELLRGGQVQHDEARVVLPEAGLEAVGDEEGVLDRRHAEGAGAAALEAADRRGQRDAIAGLRVDAVHQRAAQQHAHRPALAPAQRGQVVASGQAAKRRHPVHAVQVHALDDDAGRARVGRDHHLVVRRRVGAGDAFDARELLLDLAEVGELLAALQHDEVRVDAQDAVAEGLFEPARDGQHGHQGRHAHADAQDGHDRDDGDARAPAAAEERQPERPRQRQRVEEASHVRGNPAIQGADDTTKGGGVARPDEIGTARRKRWKRVATGRG